ncbi:MAG: ATP-binding cassette domain-containing protein [candidate division Zixibacteria bacterium]|nr:ATP-binding cassette domain-containing protein [candidate division Zixibacteria bacterium]
MNKFRHITPYLRRYRSYIVIGAVAIIATNALALYAPMVLRNAVDRMELWGKLSESLWVAPYLPFALKDAMNRMLTDAVQSRLVWDALFIVALGAGAGVFRFVVRRTVIWGSRKIEYDLRGDLFKHILTLDGSFFDKTPTGDIITRASVDVEQVRLMVGPGIMQGTNTIATAGVAIPMMMYLDPQLALYVLIPLPILAVSTHYLGQIAHRRFLAIQERFSQLSASVQESLAGMRVIKTHVREQEKTRDFHTDNQDYFRLNMRLIKLWGGFFPLLSMLSGSAVLIVLYFGGKAVIDGSIGLGAFLAFTIYLGMLIWPMIALGWVVSLYQRGTASLKRISHILDTEPRVVNPPPDRVQHLPESGALDLRDLSFSYGDNGHRALSNVTATIHPGETVAIAGPTGSGKSTLAQLIWRRYAVPDGRILYGGVDMNTVTLDEWRKRIAMVPQEAFLFSDTLMNNIALTDAQLTEARLRDVGELAAFNKDVDDFPRGYGTIVGERGITLSGGQKQRATLARALVSPADILILDDAFSAVDAQTEEEILSRLNQIFGSRIILLITHRISTLQRADRILFLDAGQLRDSGTHDDMVARGGPYARWEAREAIKEKLEKL